MIVLGTRVNYNLNFLLSQARVAIDYSKLAMLSSARNNEGARSSSSGKRSPFVYKRNRYIRFRVSNHDGESKL